MVELAFHTKADEFQSLVDLISNIPNIMELKAKM